MSIFLPYKREKIFRERLSIGPGVDLRDIEDASKLMDIENIERLQEYEAFYPNHEVRDIKLYLGSTIIDLREYDFFSDCGETHYDSGYIVDNEFRYLSDSTIYLNENHPSYHLLMREYACGLLTDYAKIILANSILNQTTMIYRRLQKLI